MPAFTSARARAAVWLWSDERTAGERLGMAARDVRSAVAGRPTRQAEERFDAAWRRLSPSQKHALDHGDEMIKALSRDQRERLKQFDFSGRKFQRATKEWTRKRDKRRPTKTVGDYIEETYS